jgi:hypothetical protein
MTVASKIELVLADIDLFCKLANWDMLDCIPAIFGCSWNEIASLSTLKFRIQREITSGKPRLLKTPEIAAKALAIVEAMRTLPEPSEAVIADLQRVPTIDPGEAVLFAVASADPSARILTGDKRALIGLYSATKDSGLLTLHRRVICLEQVVGEALLRNGIAWLREKICSHRDIDTAIAAIMGSRCDASDTSVLEGLRSYVNSLSIQCGELLDNEFSRGPSFR